MNSIVDLAAPTQAPRMRHVFAFPKRERDLLDREPRTAGVTHVALVELTAEEEISAGKRGGVTDQVRTASELVLESLRGVGRADAQGKIAWRELRYVDGTAIELWGLLPPKVRQLVVTAYSDVHIPAQEDTQGFLESRSAG